MFKLREMLEEIRTDMEPMTDMRFIRDQVNTAAQMKVNLNLLDTEKCKLLASS